MKSIVQSYFDVMEVQEFFRSLKRFIFFNFDLVYLVYLFINLSKYEDEKLYVLFIGGFFNNKSFVGVYMLLNFIRY